eukprot:2709203-Amphidinium_carterae.1
MLALSLLLADGATVLDGQSQSEVHDQFIDGRGCYYLNLSTLDTAVTVEEPGLQVEWQRPKTECFYDEYTGIELPREGVIRARHEEMEYMKHLRVWKYSTVEEALTLYSYNWKETLRCALGRQ